MKKEEFIILRKLKKISQDELANKLLVPIAKVRKWENGEAIPFFDDIEKLSTILEVSCQELLDMFEPPKTNVEKNLEEESRMYEILIQLFRETNDAERFINFAHLMSISKTNGVAICQDYIFPFYKVIVQSYGDTVVLLDNDSNNIVFTITNIKSVQSISCEYDVYTFELVICCPMFPVHVSYSPNTFRQTIRISFFNR